MRVLALESSCDETAAAIFCSERGLLASEVASQIAIHRTYGGVVPEVASREHLTHLRPVVGAALERASLRLSDIDAVAATAGPGLATSLMIGLSAAKGLALGLKKPFLAINHLEGHLLSPFFPGDNEPFSEEIPPSLGLVVSGGHTLLVDIQGFGRYRLLGTTRDDAAGEAFDKVGKLLGLPYPGGPVIDQLARLGNPARFDFPRSMLDSGDFAFSFSGLKTAVRYLLPKLPDRSESTLADVCASFQEAVVDVLRTKTLAAARQAGRSIVAVSGGVSCNGRLREALGAACAQKKLALKLAGGALCTDNAAMISFVAMHRLARREFSPITTDIDPNLRLV
ncbi:MAG: tRNA (adenosine(37)-N6)-threonylcarbamoyltransferase complex transferase subunit TsaD [Chthoniobacteraceae bacterium]